MNNNSGTTIASTNVNQQHGDHVVQTTTVRDNEDDSEDDSDEDAELTTVDVDIQQQQQQEQQRLYDPSCISRKKMETRAVHLIEQVDMLEKASKIVLTSNSTYTSTETANIRYTSDNTSTLLLSEDDGMIAPIHSPNPTTVHSHNYRCRSSMTRVNTAVNERTIRASTSYIDYEEEEEVDDDDEEEIEVGDVTKKSLLFNEASLADELSSNEDVTSIGKQHEQISQHCTDRLEALEKENNELRSMLSTYSQAVRNVQTNADVKQAKLELEIVQLRQLLFEEEATNSKLTVLNQSLQKQLQMTASDIIQMKHHGKIEKEKYIDFKQRHEREILIEKHLNNLLISRNQAIQEATDLRQILVSSCYKCRQRVSSSYRRNQLLHSIGVRKSNNNLVVQDDENNVNNNDNKLLPSITDDSTVSLSSSSSSSKTTISKSSAIPTTTRPTYQSSARQLVLNQQLRPVVVSPTATSTTSALKSCLKQTTTTSATGIEDAIAITPPSCTTLNRNDEQPSPKSITSIFLDTTGQTESTKQKSMSLIRKSFRSIDSSNPTTTINMVTERNSSTGTSTTVATTSTNGYYDNNNAGYSDHNNKNVFHLEQQQQQHHHPNEVGNGDYRTGRNHDNDSNCPSDSSSVTSPSITVQQQETAAMMEQQHLLYYSSSISEPTGPPVPLSMIPNAATQRRRDLQRHSYLISTSTGGKGKGSSHHPSSRGSGFFGFRRKKDILTTI